MTKANEQQSDQGISNVAFVDEDAYDTVIEPLNEDASKKVWIS